MLIELRSSATDPNNTPSNLMTRFKETMLIRPNTKVALVSALLTTTNTAGYTVDTSNNVFQVGIHGLHNTNDANQTITIPTGNYSGDQLASEIQTQLRTAINNISDSLPLTLYPNANVLCAFDDQQGFQITIHAEPQDWVNIPARVDAWSNAQLYLTDLGAFNTVELLDQPTPTCYGHRLNEGTQNTRGIVSANPILLKNGNVGGADWQNESLGLNPNDVIWGLSINENAEGVVLSDSGKWFLNLIEGITLSGDKPVWFGGSPTQSDASQNGYYAFFTPYQGEHGYDWVMCYNDNGGGGATLYYVKYDETNHPNFPFRDLQVYPNDVAPVVGNITGTYRATTSPDGRCRSLTTASLALQTLTLEPNCSITREQLPRTYARVSQAKKLIQIYKGNAVIGSQVWNPTAPLGVRWLLKGDIDDGNLATSILTFQVRIGGAGWATVALDGGATHAHIATTAYVYGICKESGRLLSGVIGKGLLNADNTAQSVRPANLVLTNVAGGNVVAGEQLYDGTGAGSNGGWWVATATTATIGSSGTLNEVKPMGGRFAGNYTQGDVVELKSSFSATTATLTIGAPQDNITITNAGSNYSIGLAKAVPTTAVNNVPPYGTSARTTTDLPEIWVNITADNVGAVQTFTIVNAGYGFQVGDTLTLNQDLSNNDCVITINAIGDSTYQHRNLQISSYKNLPYEPMDLQNQAYLDFTNGGNSEMADDLNLMPPRYNGDALGTPIVQSNPLPTLTNTSNETILVQAQDFPIDSRDGVGNSDNHIATLPYQTDLSTPATSEKQFIQPYNLLYHKLKNTEEINLNHLNMKLTNFDGTERTDLLHPTELTLHLIEDYG